MAVVKQHDQKCDTCAILDTETYKAVKVSVCYFVDKKDGKPVAINVKTKDCGGRYWQRKK